LALQRRNESPLAIFIGTCRPGVPTSSNEPHMMTISSRPDMPFITLWTLQHKQCVVFVNSLEDRYDLRVIEDGVTVRQQRNLDLDHVVPVALEWQRQFVAVLR
jgi:hypothetical protein